MPDALDACVATAAATALAAGFLCWAAVGNTVAGRRADFFHPLASKAKGFQPSADRADAMLKAYLLSYLAVVIAVITQWGKLRRAVRKKFSGKAPHPAIRGAVTPVSSTSSTVVAAATPSPSATSITAKASRKRAGRNRSRSQMRRSVTPEKELRVEIPNVIRSSVVADKIIPSLPRMSMNEDTEVKINRLMKKFESIDTTSMDQESEESLIKGKKKA